MSASDYRCKARETLQGNWANAVLVAFLAAILGGLIASSNGSFSLDLDAEYLNWLPGSLLAVLAFVGGVSSSFSLAAFILSGVIQLGYAQYLLKQQDKAGPDVKDLFSQFHRFGQGFLQAFLRSLFTALWSLLFIIPGIMKAYSYAMTPFIMAERPELTAKEAITISKEMMDGHKWDLFVLDLSFIGWDLLCVLTCGIGHLFLNPYTNTAHAVFYRTLSPSRIVNTTYTVE